MFVFRLLVDQKIASLNDVKEAILKLHGKGPKTVVVSSTEIDNKLEALVSNSTGKLNIQLFFYYVLLNLSKINTIYYFYYEKNLIKQLFN